MLRSFFAALLVAVASFSSAIADDGVYELRVYTCEPGKLEALNSRFENHTMRLFEKHGMKNIAYWTPTDESDNRLIYIIRHESRDAAKKSWDAFRNDSEWKEVAKASREAHGKILAKGPESTYMSVTDYSPEVGHAAAGKLYEIRTYITNEGKLDNLNARFRDHTMKIFARHGLKSFAYWTPTDGEKASNTLIYVLEYENRDAAKAGWKGFGGDPEWKAARTASEKDGKILAERPQSTYMAPTSYSPQ